METFNDDDQAQQLKDWWKQNWQPILLGLGLSIGGVMGWNAWQSHQQQQAELASGHYEQLRLSLTTGNIEAANAARQSLVDEYPSSPYAAQAALMLAQYYMGQNDYESAGAHLQWASENADDERLKRIATLRLARVRWAQGEQDAALALLKGSKHGAFTPLFAELRGDILLDQGEVDRARDAYQEALSHVDPDAVLNNGRAAVSLQQKLSDLGAAPAANRDNS